MKIAKAGSSASSWAPAENFTGRVRRDPLVAPESPGRAVAGCVTFEPGARTAWHTHPAGQILIITAGKGWVQREGGPREEVTPGDSVWFDANEKHWHGATDKTAMTHIAVTEFIEGEAADWLEHVSDADYDYNG
ncbi:cupin [Sulfitobacter sp. EhC04]|uniref:(R)-mandelonitrile lyase n=1 Tax=Sulfitobacter sp. EhC04 TaxID=1849168 RepID=UPI0007F47B0C|nr:cupin domain-containing protein [Sulfitobacter sp. EhC04]OAN75936.1 cupin [Sulfitobacter sp. EhC04]